jgi:hypothetical protein
MYDMNGYEDYFNYLTKTINKHVDESIDKKLLNIWFNLLESMCKDYFYEYITGDRDGYELSDNEIEDTFQKAGYLYASDLLDELCEEGIVNVSVNQTGDLLYSQNK